MKNRRLQFAYRKSASSLHRKVGDCLRNSEVFQHYKIYQEYPVNKVNEDFDSGREKFDWVILDMSLVIECHGKQHYEPVTFGGISEEAAQNRLKAQKEKDELKKQAALSAGFNYVTVPYTDESKISEEYILQLSQAAQQNQRVDRVHTGGSKDPSVDWKSAYERKKQWLKESGIEEKQKARAREIRKQQYKRAKKWKKKLKEQIYEQEVYGCPKDSEETSN